jgi:hypothetical protein
MSMILSDQCASSFVKCEAATGHRTHSHKHLVVPGGPGAQAALCQCDRVTGAYSYRLQPLDLVHPVSHTFQSEEDALKSKRHPSIGDSRTDDERGYRLPYSVVGYMRRIESEARTN